MLTPLRHSPCRVTVWAWGSNSSGEIGDDRTVTERYVPFQVPGIDGVKAIAAGWEYTAAVKNDGTVWVWGNNWQNQFGYWTAENSYTPVQVTGIYNARAIAAGEYCTFALK